MDKYSFGEFVYNKRKQLNMTQDELGRLLGVTNKAVSKWETGETLPDISLLQLLASTLKVSVDELLTQQEKVVTSIETHPEMAAKSKNKWRGISFILVGVILFLVSIVIIQYNNLKPHETMVNQVELNSKNYHFYYKFTPCVSFEIEKDEMKITSSISSIHNRYEASGTVQFTVNYTIHFYYENSNGSLSTISYVHHQYILNTEDSSFHTFTFSPMSTPTDFVLFKSFEIEYSIDLVEGNVILKEVHANA